MSDWTFHVWTWLLERLQRICNHDPAFVRADILEGDDQRRAIQWCPICGAWRRADAIGLGTLRVGEWRTPHPTWEGR